MDSTTTRTPTQVIEAVRVARKTEQAAAFAQLELALEWALLHPCPQGELPAHWGAETLHTEDVLPLAGPGAPWVAEFAPVDLAAALGISHHSGRQLIGDALELAHRLPRLWDLARDGRVPVWRARQVAQLTTDLTTEAALFADRLIAATPDKIAGVDAERLITEARLFFDPDRAVDEEQHALAKRGVWIRHGSTPATTEVFLTLDTPDALLLQQHRGPDRPRPQRARRHRRPRCPPGPGGRDPRRPPTRPGPDVRPRRRRPLRPSRGCREPLRPPQPRATSQTDLDDRTGAASIERLGAATTRLLTDWLTRYAKAGAKINLRPVLDLGSERRGRPARPTRRPCANKSSSATPTASSPAAAATPGPATSTTSPNTSR